MASRIPWEEIKKSYIQGTSDDSGHRIYPSMQALADKYKIAKTSISRHSAKEGWSLQREQFAAKVLSRSAEKAAEAISDEGLDLNVKIFSIANALADRIRQMMVHAEDGREINALSAALKNVQSVSQASLGDKTAENELNINVKIGDET